MSKHQAADDPLFPVAAMIAAATDHARRAELILRTPDAVLVSHGPAMQDACTAAGFLLGAHYITVRSALLNAMRTRTGEIPDEYRNQAEIWRRGLVAFAGASHG